MDEDLVEIIEHYDGAIMTRKTVNGVEVPVDSPGLPSAIIQRQVFMTKLEAEEIYGKFFN